MTSRTARARALTLGAAALLLGGALQAQVATSASFTLDGVALAGSADGAGADATAALVAQEPLAHGGELSSSAFRAEVGFLQVHDPLGADGPTVFAITPDHGTIDGGTPVTIRGLHFDRGGLAGPVSASIGGAPLVNPVVVSDTTIVGEAPVGIFGPQDVDVTTALGATGLGEAFVYSPGLAISPVAYQTGQLVVRNYGPPAASYQTFFSTFQTSIPLPPYGTLLIGPAQLVPAIENGVYPAGGVHEVKFPVPLNPVLHGATLYLQSVAVLSLAPLDIRFVNSDSVLLF